MDGQSKVAWPGSSRDSHEAKVQLTVLSWFTPQQPAWCQQIKSPSTWWAVSQEKTSMTAKSGHVALLVKWVSF